MDTPKKEETTRTHYLGDVKMVLTNNQPTKEDEEKKANV